MNAEQHLLRRMAAMRCEGCKVPRRRFIYGFLAGLAVSFVVYLLK